MSALVSLHICMINHFAIGCRGLFFFFLIVEFERKNRDEYHVAGDFRFAHLDSFHSLFFLLFS